MIHLATITSMVHPTLHNSVIEEGFYELKVHTTKEKIAESGDPQGFCRHLIAVHLATCVQATGLPLNERCWGIEFGHFMRKQFNYPKGIIS